jgi:hypothetical protein
MDFSIIIYADYSNVAILFLAPPNCIMISYPAAFRKGKSLGFSNRFPRPSGNNLPGQQNPVLTILRIKTPAGLIKPLPVASSVRATFGEILGKI